MGSRVIKSFIAIIFGVMVYAYFQTGPLVSFDRVNIVIGAEQEGSLRFSYRYAPIDPDFSKRRTRKFDYQPGKFLKLDEKLFDARISNIRIGLTENRPIDIASVRLSSHFRAEVYFDANQLNEVMVGNNVQIERLSDKVVRLTPTGPEPIVDFNYTIPFHQSVLSVTIPILAAGVLFLLLLPWQWSQSIIYHDLQLTGANPQHINALDGLRGLAALSVVGDHAWGWMTGSGTFGVWIFFALSGFLLLTPIIKQPQRGLSGSYIVGYLRRRALRIIPLYYAVLVTFYLADRQMDKLFQHMLFIRGDGHLWSLPEEIFFYLCLPFVALIIGLTARINNHFALIVLIIIWLILIRYPDIIPFKVYAFGGDYRLHLGWFIGGGVAAYLVYLQGNRTIPIPWQNVISWFALFLLVASIAYSSMMVYELIHGKRFAVAKTLPLPFAIISAFLVWAFSVTPDAQVSKFLSTTPLRLMGLVGFGLYLIHPMILFALDTVIFNFNGQMADGKIRFVLTALISIWLAAIAYKLIERPFLQIAKVTK